MILGIIGSIFVRIFLNIIQIYFLRKKIIPKRKLLVITNTSEDSIRSILQDIENTKIYEIIGYSNLIEKDNISLSYAGAIKEIEILTSQHQCDEILYIDSDFSKKELYKIWEFSKIY